MNHPEYCPFLVSKPHAPACAIEPRKRGGPEKRSVAVPTGSSARASEFAYTTRSRAVVACLLIVCASSQLGLAQAQDIPASETIESTAKRIDRVDPYQAVREGNRLLKEGKPADALELYEQAKREKPDAREIAFAEGLSQYHLGDYERARDLFRQAADGKNDDLADDATYSLGTTYHSDALLSQDDPKAALAQLEQAMEHYQNVLSHDPDHAAARDAYRKAGTTWRTIKQQMQQQQQSSDNQDQNDKDKNENENQNENQQQSDQKQDQSQENEQKQQSSEDQQQSQEQKDKKDQQPYQEQEKQDQENQEQSSESPEQEKDDASASKQQDQKDQEKQQQEASAEQEEQVSREQAERKLREMMQAIRERKERRREPTRLVPVRPVDKDW